MRKAVYRLGQRAAVAHTLEDEGTRRKSRAGDTSVVTSNGRPVSRGGASAPSPEIFQGFRFSPQSSTGLFLPTESWERHLQEIEEIEKAGVRAEGLRTQLGTLISQYYTLFANMVTYGAAEKPRGTPPPRLLREAARRSLVDSTIIEARIHQTRHVAHRVSVEGKEKGFQVVHVRQQDPNFKPAPDIVERCEAMVELLENPNPEYHPGGIQDFLVKAVRGHLTLDRIAMVMVKDSSGRPRSFHLLPPDGIRPRYQALYTLLQQNPQFRSMEQIVELVWTRDRVEIDDRTAYVQLLEDQRIYGAWSKEEMCLPYTATVLTDQGPRRIGDLVKYRVPALVRSFNRETGGLEWRRVVGWSRRLNREPLVVLRWSGRKVEGFRATPNHPVWTPRGWVPVGKLQVGDEVHVAGPRISAAQRQVILGTLLGDGCLKVQKTAPALTLSHGPKQYGYLDWKAKSLGNLGSWRRRTHRSSTIRPQGRTPRLVASEREVFETRALLALSPIADLVKPGWVENRTGRKIVTRAWLDQVDALGLAVWIMDDGSMRRDGQLLLCTDGYSEDECQVVVAWLRERWALQAHIIGPPSFYGKYRVSIPKTSATVLIALLSEYLLFDGTKKRWIAEALQPPDDGAVAVRLTAVERRQVAGRVFDIEVEGTHTFTSNGLIAHNSVCVANPSDEIDRAGWGISPLEASLEGTTLLLNAFNFNKQAFSSFPEAMGIFQGKVDREGFEAFKQSIYSQAGPGSSLRLPMFATGTDAGNAASKFQLVKLRDSFRDMTFPQLIRMMVALKAAAYRCFDGDTVIETERGPLTIREIVSKRLPVQVRSFDRETGQVGWAPVVAWQRFPQEREWVTVWYPGGKKFRRLMVTADHEVWTDQGCGAAMVRADKLAVGDRVFVLAPGMSPEQEQVLLGSLLGDGNLHRQGGKKPRSSGKYRRHGPRGLSVPHYSESHAVSQGDYLRWKGRALGSLGATVKDVEFAARPTRPRFRGAVLRTPSLATLDQYHRLCYSGERGQKRLTWSWLSRLDPLGLAVWFMDDGDVQVNHRRWVVRWTLPPSEPEDLVSVLRVFGEKWGCRPVVSPAGHSRAWRLRFHASDSDRLLAIMAPYVVPEGPVPESRTCGCGSRGNHRVGCPRPTRTRGSHHRKKRWIAGEIPQGPTAALVPVPVLQVRHHALEHAAYCVTAPPTHTLFANRVASAQCHPILLNFAPDSGGQRPLISNETQEQAIALAQEEGLHCVPWHTCVETDQGPLAVGRIVRDRLAVRVKSFDGERVVWAPITQWSSRPNPEGLWKIQWGRGGRYAQFLSTPCHRVLTARGWVRADQITTADRVAVTAPRLSPEQEEIVLGSLLGDGFLVRHSHGRRGGGWPQFRVVHGDRQLPYSTWKAESLSTLKGAVEPRPFPRTPAVIRGRAIRGGPQHVFRVGATPGLWDLWTLAYPGGKKTVSREWLDRLGVRGLAVWAMDDGSLGVFRYPERSTTRRFVFCTNGFSVPEVRLLRVWLSERFGLDARILFQRGRPMLWLTASSTRRFQELVAPYLRLGDHEKTWLGGPSVPQGPTDGAVWLPVTGSEPAPSQGAVYDIMVPGTQCFVVHGLVVHNSLLDVISSWLTRELIRPWYPDLKMIFTVQDAPQEIDELNLWMIRTNVGYTVDEFRAAQGQPTLERATGGKVKGDYVNNQSFFQQRQMNQMEEQMAAEQAAMAQNEAAGLGMPSFAGGQPGGGNGGGAPPKGAAVRGMGGANVPQLARIAKSLRRGRHTPSPAELVLTILDDGNE